MGNLRCFIIVLAWVSVKTWLASANVSPLQTCHELVFTGEWNKNHASGNNFY